MAFRFSWWRRLRAFLQREELDRGLDDEIRFHIEQQSAKHVRLGMTPDEARRAALLQFGGVEPLKERTRDEFRPALVQDFWRDMRVGARILRRSPGFATAAILTIGLGTGAATAVFTVVHGVLMRPLPYPDAHRLVRVYQLGQTGGRGSVSDLNFADWQTHTRSFEAMARFSPWGAVPVLGGAEPAMAATTVVSREFFDVMRVRPALGRAFAPGEQRLGGVPAAIVSHTFWTRWLGGAAFAAQAVRIGDRRYQVVGVMPPGFDYPAGTGVWLARELNPPDASRTAHNNQAIARLRDGVEAAAARAEIGAVSRALKVRHGDGTWMFDADVAVLLDQLTATSRPVLQLLFGAALLLLVVATINVSSLLLARAAARQHEFAVQLAIGAGRTRIARQLLAETLVLCAAGAAVGLLTATWAVRALIALGPSAAPRLDQVDVDWTALAFAVGVSTLATMVLALLSTIGTRDVRLASALSDGHRTGTAGRGGLLARQALVAAQVALTLVLLAGTGLLGRSFAALLAVDPGFTLDNALVVDLAVTSGGSDFRSRRVATLDAVLDRLGSLPGVTHAGLITGFPLGGGNYSNGQFLEMTSVDELQSAGDIAKLPAAVVKARAGQAGYRLASRGYFQTMGIPLVRGQMFDGLDAPDLPHVAVISESLANTKWPGQDPIGRFVQFGNMDGDRKGFRIIGIVGDVRELTPEAPPGPLFYGSYRQRPNSVWRLSVVLRGPAPERLAPTVQRTMRELDPELPIQVRTVDEAFDRVLLNRRFSLVLITAFGGAALLLATLGLYGLVSYVVAQRTREIGIRMALGATSGHLVALVVGRGALLAVLGSAAGLVAALALSHVVQGLVFGISPTDPGVLTAVAAITIASAILASYVPARRATRAAPVNSLRSQ